ncbi:D-alanyl-D-alanine carboxypeptidase family protein [Eupransor demetentiae]|uniref:D-alanyl-D-alanine carboxypeptidase (DacC) n=1 Tax=Eupransor demetentiae TaxID=3109584 RepID=A0ABM9N2T6_9LACO|nr:D-alanyl-D-alanine carboxypeptidase (DacC) [Lactobacillaceae bacterium LMG 33000]
MTKRNFPYKAWLGFIAIPGLIVFLFVHNLIVDHANHDIPNQLKAQKVEPVSLNVNANSALVVDLSSGQILGEKDANKQVPIASQSKLLTAYGVLKAVKVGKISWQSQVKIPASADLSGQTKDLFSHLDIKAGDKVSVKDLYTAMFTNSANDAAFSLASYLTPKGKTTQEVLQGWAKELDLTDSAWYNAAGQKNGDAFGNRVKSAPDSASNHASAKELAKIVQADLQLDPELKQIAKMKTLTYTKNGKNKVTVQTDYGKVQGQLKQNYGKNDVLTIGGVKTGSTPESGAAFTGFVTDSKGHEFLTVINGAGDYQNKTQRFQATFQMVRQVLQARKAQDFKAGSSMAQQKKVDSATTRYRRIPVHVAQSKSYWTDADQALEIHELKNLKDDKGKVAKNELVARARLTLDTDFLNEDDGVSLAADKDVPAVGFFTTIWHWIWH